MCWAGPTWKATASPAWSGCSTQRLLDPARRGEPVALSIDSRVQAVLESELATAVTAMSADGGTGIVLDVRTGEVIAMASAPTFNPNAAGRSDPSALYNRATMGVYELGSTFKPITIAAAMEAGVVTSMSQRWDATAPIAIGRFRISDDHPLGRRITVAELMVHSLQHRHRARRRRDGRRADAGRVPRARLQRAAPDRAARARPAAVAARLGPGDGDDLGLRPRPRDHAAAPRQRLCGPGQWRHLAAGDPAAGSSRASAAPGRRVYSAQTSYRIRQLLRLVVPQGTGRRAEAPGFRVGGKTGTAEKARRRRL